MWQFVYMLVAAAISYAVAPKPKIEKPTAGTLDIPTPKMGQPIAVVFGEVWIESPAISYYGNAVADPIKSKSGK